MMQPRSLATTPEHSRAGRKKAGFFIGVTCPGCGGKLDLDDDFIVLVCDHCDSVLRVHLPDSPPAYMVSTRAERREIRFRLDRFLKERDLPLSDSSLQLKNYYYPYWKVDGILLKLRNKIYEKQIGVDTEYSRAEIVKQEKREISLSPYTVTSAAGMTIQGLPMSLGMRADYLKVIPYAQENIPDDCTSLPITKSWADMIEDVNRSVGHMASLSVAKFGKNLTELYRPIGSIVYFPFAVAESYSEDQYQRFVIDGITGNPVEHASKPPPLDNQSAERPVSIKFGQLDISFHRCEVCGGDLPPERSYVNICRNCQNVNFYEGRRFEFDGLYMADHDVGPNEEYYGFWTYKIPGEQAEEIRRLFGGIFKSDWLAVPAFRMNHFEAMYRLTKRMSSAIPEIDLCEVQANNARFRDVTVGEEEARLNAQVAIQRRRLTQGTHNLDRLKIDFDNVPKRLIFVPFRQQSYFCVDTVLGAVTFEKTAVD